MASKTEATLKTSEEVRNTLRAMKRGQETYDDLLRRLIQESDREPYTTEVADDAETNGR